jgi:predicted transglutaminase-like protease
LKKNDDGLNDWEWHLIIYFVCFNFSPKTTHVAILFFSLWKFIHVSSRSSIWIITYEREQKAAPNEDIHFESFMRLTVCKYSPLMSTYAHSFLHVVYIWHHIFVQFFFVQKISSRHFYSLYVTINYHFLIYLSLK